MIRGLAAGAPDRSTWVHLGYNLAMIALGGAATARRMLALFLD